MEPESGWQWRARILSNGKSGFGGGASHEATRTPSSGVKALLAKRLSAIEGSDSVGPKAQITLLPSQAVAVRGEVDESESEPGERNFKVLCEILRRFRIVTCTLVGGDRRRRALSKSHEP